MNRPMKISLALLTLVMLALPALAGKPVNVAEVPVVSAVAGDGQVLADPTIPNYRQIGRAHV